MPALMHLLRDLLLSAARWGFTFTAAHVPGVENKIADAIQGSPQILAQQVRDHSLTVRQKIYTFLGGGGGGLAVEGGTWTPPSLGNFFIPIF